jgi:hypothetical protein
MKFVNKLSVISLVVLMFSFMNVAQAADACQGTSVSACSKIKDQSQCANNYVANKDGSGKKCIWGEYCYNGGAACGKPISCPTGTTYSNGTCVVPSNSN